MTRRLAPDGLRDGLGLGASSAECKHVEVEAQLEIVAYGFAGIVAVPCVALHCLAMKRIYRASREERRTTPRAPLIVAPLLLLLVHVVEIWLFGIAYGLLADSGFGHIEGASTLLDYVYFSAAIYTTVGLGDLSPVGPIRALVGAEGLIGLILIAWSATLLFMQLERHWERDQ